MRGIQATLLVGFIGLVGILIWNGRQWLPLRGTQAVSSSPTAASKLVGESSGKTDPKKTGARNKREPDRADRAVPFKDLPLFCGGAEGASAALCCQIDCSPAQGKANAQPRAPVAPGAPLFPTRDDLPAGATSVQIRARFGEPTARATETRDGRVFERYYYFNRDHTQLTVATLKAGVIVSAENILP
jgi:hypothetical protein